MTAGNAWYCADRGSFLDADSDCIVAQLTDSAFTRGWHVEPEQHEEWSSGVKILQGHRLDDGPRTHLEIVKAALAHEDLAEFTHVVLEYDFRRRGLRIDCVLLAPGIVAVIEFKRSKLVAANRDQVMHYCINLVEFHEYTRKLSEQGHIIVVPILALTEGSLSREVPAADLFHQQPWASILRSPLECDSRGLTKSLRAALRLRRSRAPVVFARWLESKFSPSSTILDAAISLFGHHDVSAIDSHAVPARMIDDCVMEVSEHIREAQQSGRNRIVLVSGAPGAGKTLVGLRLAFSPEFREDAVFVTGNAPLVDVLTQALKDSYSNQSRRQGVQVVSGYAREDIHSVIRNSTFKLVKAHKFLGERGKNTASSDGRIVIFDEAQRTYEKGRDVARKKLPDHEADLILASLEESYEPGSTIVALLGHNQAINTGERGAIAWLEAAKRKNWDVAISDETLALTELSTDGGFSSLILRRPLRFGHLSHSMRFYRNKGIEEWSHAVLENAQSSAKRIARGLAGEGHAIRLTRNLATARRWVRAQRVGDERIGLIASAQAHRLAAEGLFVGLKPPIANWMLAPTGDIRSSNMLEVVQNQYQVQGLELDYTIVCWDADLRRAENDWFAFRIRAGRWTQDSALEVAKNGYRVLLTRARKGMVIFLPRGDESGEDTSRCPAYYDGIAKYLVTCGAELID